MVLDAAESRQPDDQAQADKDQLGLITETHSTEGRTIVRVLLCHCVYASSDVLCSFLYEQYSCTTVRIDLNALTYENSGRGVVLSVAPTSSCVLLCGRHIGTLSVAAVAGPLRDI